MSLFLFAILMIAGVAVVLYLAITLLSPEPKATAPVSIPTPPSSAQTVPAGGPYCYGGVPVPQPIFHDTITILTNTGYLVGYCEARRDPVWACYRLFKPTSQHAPPRPQGFQVDLRTRARVNQHDYTGSGYDRGHMAPNYAIAVCYGAQAQLETFLMSNIIPQRPHLNRQIWEHLEQTEIKEYACRHGQIWVIDGPIFGDHPDHMRDGITVPESCFKIIVEEEGGLPRVMAFIMPQSVTGTEEPRRYLTNVKEIERETRLAFFPCLPQPLRTQIENRGP